MTNMLHTNLTRRDFLGTSAAAAAASALPNAASAQGAEYRRWEITDPAMPPRVLDSYKKGIHEMLKRPATDPQNWYRNAFVHIFDCPHGNWWFLPWHRAYLGWLEQTIRELSGDKEFALPYWDWTKTPRVPTAMFDDVLDPNNDAFIASFDSFKTQFDAPVNALWGMFSPAQKDVLAQRGLNTPADFWARAQRMFFDRPDARGLTAGNPDLDQATKVTVANSMIRAALQTRTFAESANGSGSAGFASAQATNHNGGTREGILEGQPHDNVHGAMGGPTGLAFMVSFLSPVDPIFFLHHGNLDRLWDVWTRRQAALKRPTLPQGADFTTWSSEQFLFFSDAMGQPVTKTNAGDYTAISVFDYDYSPGSGEDQVPAPVSVVASVPATQHFSARITSSSINDGAPAGGIVEVPATLLQAGAAPEALRPVAEITLNLGPADQGRRFRVLVSPGTTGNAVEAGGITVFGHAHGLSTFTVPLPENLEPAVAGANLPLDIRVVPIEEAGGTSPSALAKTTARTALRSSAAPVQVTAITVSTS